MRHTRVGIRKAALVCGAAALAAAATAPGALAAAGHSHYASFNFAGESVTDPAVNFPLTQITTDSTAPSQASGQSTFLNDATPFGQVFGSSQGRPYALLRSAKGLNPSTTVLHFDRPLVPGTWGFALGDVDAEKVQVTAYDAAGHQIPASALGFQDSFNFCQFGTPRPNSCNKLDTDEPRWDPASSYLVGNVADTNGASGWFRPASPVATLELYSVVQTGIPVYQLWLAATDQPSNPLQIIRREEAPPVVTPPGQSVVIPVCEGTSKNIDLISGAEHGKVTSHDDCTVTYTPNPGFTGTDNLTLRIETADGQILVRSFDVKVERTLPSTGMPGGLIGDAAAALALLGTGVVLTLATRKARKA